MSNLNPSSSQDKRCHGLEVVQRQGPGVGRGQWYEGVGGRPLILSPSEARRSDASLSRGTKLLPRVGGRSSQSPFHGREGSNVQREVVPEDLWRLLLTYISIIFRGGRLTPRTVREWRNVTDERWQGVIQIRNMTNKRPNKREDHHSNWHNKGYLSCPREHHFSFGEASFVLVFGI